MIFGIILAIVVTLLLLWLGNGVRRIGAVSAGERISNRNGSALLLIDLQSVFWERGPYSNAAKEAAARVIFSEIETARAQGHPVIAVRQEWSIPSTKAVAKLSMNSRR
jgi:hypothetical protein